MAQIVETQAPPLPVSETEDHVRIEPSRGWVAINLADIWRYRELLYFLVWRDIKVRYKQTVLGVVWAVIQPVLSMILFTFIFGRLAGLNSEGYPYAIFNFAALVPWSLFSSALQNTSGSLVGSANLITKVYFPRLVIPIATVLSGMVDFLIQFGVLIILMFFFPVTPRIEGILVLPLLILLILVTSLGVGLWLSALNVQYRDIRYIVHYLVQFWFYASPVVYSSKMVEGPLRILYSLNPMVGVIDGFRWALLGAEPPALTIFISVLVSLALLVSGAFYFRRMERNFADII